MLDSYQKFANDVFRFNKEGVNSIFSQVKEEDLDEVRVIFAVNIIGYEHADNLRVYPVAQKEAFYRQADKGCCGSWNSQIKCISGNIYWVGCNYGH